MKHQNNPYPGPRPFTREEEHQFFGRNREARELLNCVLSNGVTLFYAQSGCGKTSLLNAKLIPKLEEEGFWPLPVARVKGSLPTSIKLSEIRNIYVFNTLFSWFGEDADPEALKVFDLRLMIASDDKPEEQLISEFENEFKSKKKECAVLIVRATSNSDRWTIAGFSDEGEFRTVLIDDPNQELSKELKKEPRNEGRIIELAVSSLGCNPLKSITLREGYQKFISKLESHHKVKDAPYVVIIDQFEEIVTAYPTRWRDRQSYFQELTEIQQMDPTIRFLFAIREDYLAHLDGYIQQLAGWGWSRLRLEPLRKDAAIHAVVRPVEGTSRRFGEGVAKRLVDNLALVQVQTELGETATVDGEFVEPVQLQVVCSNLWDRVPVEKDLIEEKDLDEFGNVDNALAMFYEESIRLAIGKEDEAKERQLRDWIEEELITSAQTRGMVVQGNEETAGISNEFVKRLEAAHLIRGEWRHGARWFELTHDRFIRPIQGSNRAFVSSHGGISTQNALRKNQAKQFMLGMLIFSWVALWLAHLDRGWVLETLLHLLSAFIGMGVCESLFLIYTWLKVTDSSRLLNLELLAVGQIGMTMWLAYTSPWALISWGIGFLTCLLLGFRQGVSHSQEMLPLPD